MFNTLKYANMLEEVGFSREQAETSVQILVEIMEDKLATKQDMRDFSATTKQDMRDFSIATQQDLKSLQKEIHDLSTQTKLDLKALETKLEHSLSQVKADMTIRMGTMLAASIAILTAIQKLT